MYLLHLLLYAVSKKLPARLSHARYDFQAKSSHNVKRWQGWMWLGPRDTHGSYVIKDMHTGWSVVWDFPASSTETLLSTRNN